MFKFKDPHIISLEAQKLSRPGVGRLRITHKDHDGKFMRSFMLIILLSIVYKFWFDMMVETIHFFHDWSFLVYCMTLVGLIIYVWMPGYVEFDNVKQIVIIKRYQYKFRTPKVISYAEVSSIELNFNQKITDYGDTYLKYFFKLNLKGGSIQPMFSLFDKQKAKKIKVWIDDHVKFGFKFKRKKLKKRKPIFQFNKNNGSDEI